MITSPSFSRLPLLLRAVMCLAVTGSASETNAETPATSPEVTVNSIGMRMVRIPAGEFAMGLNESPERVLADFPYEHPSHLTDEVPAHRVHITQPFLMGQCEVTLGQFMTFYHDAHYKLESERDGQPDWGYAGTKIVKSQSFRPWSPGWPVTNDYPVVYVSWNDAQAFCQWLSAKEAKTYRVPTEAEWEYACRAGSTRRFPFGDDLETLVWYGNGPDETRREYSPREVIVTFSTSGAKHRTKIPYPFLHGRDGYVFTAPVARFKPNAFGLYDMLGNAREWCADWYSSKYYEASSSNDPRGPDSGTKRVARGGGYGSPPFDMRSSARLGLPPGTRRFSQGFRVVSEVTTSFDVQLPIILISGL